MGDMKIALLLITVSLLTSCATSMLWDANDPHEYITISRDEITEEELKDKGLDYEVSEKWNLYYVEKSILQKTRDYIYRSFGTPVTVTVDVVTPIVVIGGISYAILESEGVADVDLAKFIYYLGLMPEKTKVPVYGEHSKSHGP